MRDKLAVGLLLAVVVAGSAQAQTPPQDHAGARIRVTGVAVDDTAQADLKEFKARKGHKWVYVFIQRECPRQPETEDWVLQEQAVSLIDAAGHTHPVVELAGSDGEYVVKPSEGVMRFRCNGRLATLCNGWEEAWVLYHLPKQAKPAKLRVGETEFLLDDKKILTGEYVKVSFAACR